MIDDRTNNKHYPLPHPENIASQDVARIADAITMIDADIVACDLETQTCSEKIESLQSTSLRIPANQVGIIDPEIANITAGRYLVVNSEGTGFTTVEGGGDEGGLKGEILVKHSDENFDTTAQTTKLRVSHKHPPHPQPRGVLRARKGGNGAQHKRHLPFRDGVRGSRRLQGGLHLPRVPLRQRRNAA